MIARADGAMFAPMLDIGFGELLLLAAIALIALGPKQLPEVARVAGRFIADMRRIAGEIAGSLIEPIVEARNGTDEIFSALKRARTPVAKSAAEPRAGTTRFPLVSALTSPVASPVESSAVNSEEDDRKRQMSFPLFDLPPPETLPTWKSNE